MKKARDPRFGSAEGSDLVTGTCQVPVGKRLVIEYASPFAFLQPGAQSMFIRIVTAVGGSDGFHALAVQSPPKRATTSVVRSHDFTERPRNLIPSAPSPEVAQEYRGLA